MANEKRLTEKHYSGNGYYLKCSTDCPNDGFCDECDKLFNAIDRLGEYEDKADKTVDAVEVVRCKDCRWARPQDHREPTETPKGCLICQCFMHHHIPAPWGARLAVNPDDFCSKGERRNDG